MTTLDLVVRAASAVLPEGQRAASVGMRDGRIAVVAALDAPLTAHADHRVADDAVLLPGFVDTHVHLQDPGHPEWESFPHGTLAAAAGGITTLVDMPLDSEPTTVDLPALAAKRAAARGRVHVDVGFWGGVVPANGSARAALHEAGVLGFKCFLSDSGAAGFPPVSPGQLREALAGLAPLGAPLLVHAEHDGPTRGSVALNISGEVAAVADVIAAARETGGRAHVVHVSAAEAADLLAAARSDGVRVTAETCPHYLCLADGAATVSPPIRGAANAERLWQHVGAALGMVVSDHSPCGPGHPGIASLGLGPALVWTAARARGHSLVDVARWMAATPARLACLPHKGVIAVGADADLVEFGPDDPVRVDVAPYAGWELRGAARRTWLRGEPVDRSRPRGRLLRRGDG
ncbi:MAG TPA: allantoinase AllB [Pseudonocardia sp.]